MHQKKKDLQKRYEGFLQTKNLWINDKVFDLQQFKFNFNPQKISIDVDEKQRLGKYIEQLFFYALQSENIKILCKNIQIQKEKLTLGELDCIILKNKIPIHLEIIYKFYLYDATVGKDEIEHFIGPNRKDSLLEKLTKLKTRQLPLIYTKECINYLKTIKLNVTDIQQQVYFVAQLFLPYSKQKTDLSILNTDCIVGYYLKKSDLSNFKDCKFYIPTKKDWIVLPHKQVSWLNFVQFDEIINDILKRKFSPLFWLKRPNGELEKYFLVWW